MGKKFEKESVGERIRKVRKALGLTMTQMRDDIDLTQSSISRYEKGNIQVPKRIQKLICQTYSINPEWLETGQGEMMDATQKKPTSAVIQEIKRNLHLPDIVVAIIEAYENLPDYKKQAVERFIDDLRAENSTGKKRLEDEENDEDSGPENLSRIA